MNTLKGFFLDNVILLDKNNIQFTKFVYILLLILMWYGG